MVNKLKFSSIACLVLAGCGGSSTGGSTPDLTEAAPNSVTLTAGTTVEAGSDSELLAVDFDNSAVGSSVTMASFGGLNNVTFTIAEPVAGNSAISISATPATGDPVTTTLVSSDLNNYLEVASEFADIDANTEQTDTLTINGVEVDVNISDFINGATVLEQGNLSITNIGGETVGGTFAQATKGTDTTVIMGSMRQGSSTFTAPATGTFIYEGVTAAFTADDSYISTTSTMTVNFAEGTGTYSADDFVPDEGSPALTISMTSDLTLNNTNGKISGSNGVITAGASDGTMGLEGVMSSDNNAVAGSITPTGATPVGGVAGAVFALPKKP